MINAAIVSAELREREAELQRDVILRQQRAEAMCDGGAGGSDDAPRRLRAFFSSRKRPRCLQWAGRPRPFVDHGAVFALGSR